MIITKKAISRRTVLRGMGTALALPMLDSMVPALTALGKTSATPPHRLGIVYVPNGVVMEQWTPAIEGSAFEFSPTLQPLSPFRSQLTILTGLQNQGPDAIHETGATRFLTCVSPKRTQGSQLQAGISMDQVVAREFGAHTQFGSLELALESSLGGATCGAGYTCAYVNTICWRGPTTPLPMEINPRVIFERLIGDGGSTDPAARRARIRNDRSRLDSVREKIARLKVDIGRRDQTKLTEYLDAVRDIERRIQRAEEQSDHELPIMDQPAGIPVSFEEHAKLMFDLQLLAYQADLTRVITFMMSREYSGRTYPEIGVPDAHHPLSHHQNNPANLAKLAKVNAYHTTLFAYYLEKLRSTADGDGTLLDHMTLLYGCGISDGDKHLGTNLPILLAGGGSGQLAGGRHLRYPGTTPMVDLHAALMQKLGVPVEERFGGGKMEMLSGI